MSHRTYDLSDGSIPGGLAGAGRYIEFFHIISGTNVKFAAFLTQLEDKFTSSWNEEEVFGRMDPIATFKKTGRKISLGWKIIAESPKHAKSNLRKVSKLIRMLYPSYASHGGIASTTHIAGPPLLKLKFMNLVSDTMGSIMGTAEENGLLGYVDGFSHTPIIEEGFIEAHGGGEETGGLSLFPKAVQMSCTFTVLHSHDIGWDEYGVWRNIRDFPYGNDLTNEQLRGVAQREVAIAVEEAEAEAAQNEEEENAAAGGGILDPAGWFGSGT